MIENTFKDRLKEIIPLIRIYANHMLSELSTSEILWRPDGTKGRTIQSYFRHMINAEIYWLKSLDDHTFEYLSKESDFNELKKNYKKLEGHLTNSVAKSSEEQLIVRVPVFEGEELKKKGTLAWMIMRTSLHAIHHLGQISHIRYSLENPPKKNPDVPTWSTIMDNFSFLKPENLEY